MTVSEPVTRPQMLECSTSTDDSKLIDYISELFYNELLLQILEEVQHNEERGLRLLLEKSRDLIDRIRAKAARGGVSFYAPVDINKLYKMLERSEYLSWHLNVNDRGSPQRGATKGAAYTTRHSPQLASSNQKARKGKHRVLGIPESCISQVDQAMLAEHQDLENEARKVIGKMSKNVNFQA